MSEIEKLSEFAVTQPQAAYAAFMHVFLHRWSYVAQTTPWSPELFHPLDDVVSLHFLPAVTGWQAFGSVERELLSLPVHLGSLGVVVPSIFHHFIPYLNKSQPLLLINCCNNPHLVLLSSIKGCIRASMRQESPIIMI